MEKIKSAVVLAIIALSAAMFSANAQDIPTATLQSGDQVQIFKGADALKNAHAAAQSGDIISLSAGTFNSTGITKAIKLRGVGHQDGGTLIINDFSIEIPDGEENLQIEGMASRGTITVKGQLKNALFRLIKKYGTLNLANANTVNCTISECRIDNVIVDKESENLLIDHCWIVSLYRTSDSSSSTSLNVSNCVIDKLDRGDYTTLGYTLQYANISNSILRQGASSSIGIIWKNCLWTSTFKNKYNVYQTASIIDSNASQSNVTRLSEDEMNALFSTEGLFTLTDEAAAKYLGTDGKQIGLYGGEVPYSEKPYVPVITKFEVPSTVDADGKLSVTVAAETR